MNSQGYTRRDHRQRKRHSRRRNELLLDRLLKIFFYILVILIVVILVKVVFLGDKKTDETGVDNQTSVNDNTTPNISVDDGSTDVSENTSENGTTTENIEDETSETEETTDSSSEEETEYVPKGDYTLFDDTAFVGDSRIGGLYLSSQLVTSTFYYDVGGNVTSAVNGSGIELNNGSKGSVVDALKQREFEYVFLQYGVNEWGWSTSGFISEYEKLVNEVKAVQPNAKIYVMAIIPVTAKYAEERAVDAMNVNLKLDEMNAEVQMMADRLGVNYIDVVEGVTGGERVLTEEMSSDGYHLNRTENLKLLDYICETIK